MRSPRPWPVRKTAASCAASGLPFQQGQSYFSALVRSEHGDGITRHDFSTESWQNDSLPEVSKVKESCLCSWLGVYHSESNPNSESSDQSRELSLELALNQLIETDDETTINLRYIIALMLERSKKIKEIDSYNGSEGLIRIYQHKSTNAVYMIWDPEFSLDELDVVQADVSEQLEQLFSKK